LRTPRYKFIQYHGIWDLDELYDMEEDPHEEHNLIFEKDQQARIKKMRADLHAILEKSNANQVPFSHKRRMGANLRLKNGASPADFPPQLMREKNAKE
jgi:N-acetylglucosamine-6-sulfatase